MATEETEKSDGRTVMLKGVRLSFTDSLKDAKPTVTGGKPKHTCNVIIETGSKHEAENKAKIVAAMQAACVMEFGEGKGDFFKTISTDDPKRVAYRKGERFKNSETQEVYKGYEGNMVIAGAGPGAGDRRPKLFNRRRKYLGEADDNGKPFFTEANILDIFYSGTVADVKVSFYGVSGKDKGGNGVFATLESIRSREEGERMAGGHVHTSADEFDDLDDDDLDETPAPSGSDFG